MISAEDAFQSGLVNAVVPQSELIDTTKKNGFKDFKKFPDGNSLCYKSR